MNATCPTCGKPVDPLRARSVGVRDGKIVGYCSTECAQAAETKPVRVPSAAPAKPMATYDSGPVIEVIHEPASGVVSSSADARLSGPEPQRESKKESKKDKRAAKQAAKKPAESAPLPVAPATPAPAPAPKAAPKAAPAAAAAKASDGDKKRPRRDSTDAKAAWDWLDDEPAEVGSGADADGSVKGKGGALLVVLLLALAGGGLVAYFLLSGKDEATPVEPAVPSPAAGSAALAPAAEREAPVAVAPPNIEAAIAKATAILQLYSERATPRIRREAASALARTGDQRAIAALRSMLDAAGRRAATNEDQISADQLEKLGMAYALARAGDKGGLDTLTRSLQSKYSREVRVEAGRLLARLGDARATPMLAQLTTLSQYKLGAAEQLAHLKDERGVAVLEAVRADAAAKPDEKARAAIALAHAGKRDVAPALVALLTDGGFGKDAAVALASLGDEAARPKLVELLAFPALRVEAAAALRRLAPERDLAEHVPALLQALDSDKDTDQIGAAEALLLLVGPAAWATAG